jgi:hypothetical protein
MLRSTSHADPVEVDPRAGTGAGRQIRQEEAVPLRRVDADKAEMQRGLGVPPSDIGINGPTIKDKNALLDEGVEVSAKEECLGELAAGDTDHLGLSVILEADDKAYLVLVTGPHSGQAGICEGSEPATALPRLVDLQMSAVMPRAGLKWQRTGPLPPTERTVWTLTATYSPVLGNSSHRALRTATVVESTISQSVTSSRMPTEQPAGRGHRPGLTQRGRP